MAKVTARVWELLRGSDDPRAIQGGGGDAEKLVARFNNSEWLIRRWVEIYRERGDELRLEFMVARV